MIQGGDSFRLVVRRGPQPNQTYELNKDIITLGRDITNDIVINDPEVSRHHMRITRTPGGTTIEDLGSTNGTFVNGQRVQGARALRNGDMVGLGETVTLGYEMAVPLGGTVPAQPSGMNPVPPLSPNAPPPAPMPNNIPAGVQPMGGTPAAPSAPAQSYTYNPNPQGGIGGYGSADPASPSYSPPSPAGYDAQQFGGSPYTAAPSPSSGALPAMGGDYDPVAMRDETPRSTTRWIVIGCAGLGLFCCCATSLGLILVDANCLWDRIPIVWQILQAFGVRLAC